MSNRKNQIPPALRHGVYSGLGPLPGEDPAAFEKFRREIFAEYNINGRSEEAIGDNLVRYMWRREHLSTYALAEHAKQKYHRIYAKLSPPIKYTVMSLDYEKETRSPEELDEVAKQADKEAQTELGAAGLELVEAGDVVTTDYLLKELSVIERLDQMIVHCFKELLVARGLKSLSSPSAATVARPRLQKVA
jgi:hypothetical protein